MKVSSVADHAAKVWTTLTVVGFAGIVGLLLSGYLATRAWEQGVTTRVAHQTDEIADLILTAISRDMRGAQARILANRDWDASLPVDDADLDMTERVALSFARYPYPESFFSWRGGGDHMTFFSRSARLPGWMPPGSRASDSPISIVVNPPGSDLLRTHVLASIAAQRRYAVFNAELAGVPYQVVARMSYADPLRERLESVSGFTVNLNWVRQQYFAEILAELGPTVSGGVRQDISLMDEANRVVVGTSVDARPRADRLFSLLFVDASDAAPDLLDEMTHHPWRLRVSAANDPMLISARRRADTTLIATIAAVVICALSLVLARRTMMHDAKLVEMRSRFVSSVTHDLRTPLANIHALSATLGREAPTMPERYRSYPNLLVQEATNLERMVDNLLAYARITDVTETYAFEPIAAAELVDEAVRSFQPRIGENGVSVHVDTPTDLLFVRADQRAMVLALRNLIDNALRHARGGGGHIRISAHAVESMAYIEVADDGSGISEKKLKALRENIASKTFAPADGGGLGVAIASRIVADHGGTLTVDSAPGQGTLCVVGLEVC